MTSREDKLLRLIKLRVDRLVEEYSSLDAPPLIKDFELSLIVQACLELEAELPLISNTDSGYDFDLLPNFGEDFDDDLDDGDEIADDTIKYVA